jgi:hypothetical protein
LALLNKEAEHVLTTVIKLSQLQVGMNIDTNSVIKHYNPLKISLPPKLYQVWDAFRKYLK